MTKRVLAIIPARGGSVGLPRKNIAILSGKPLILWTIEAAIESKYVTKVVVSSDDNEILEVSRGAGVDIIRRPDELASSTATSESVVKHAIDHLKLNREVFDVIVLLQPTSPLRDSKDIDGSLEIMFESSATAVISVCEFENKALKSLVKGKNGFLQGAFNDKYPFMRRQDLPSIYMPNGAIYAIKTNSFLEDCFLLTDKTKEYLMPMCRSIDVDTAKDLEYLSAILSV